LEIVCINLYAKERRLHDHFIIIRRRWRAKWDLNRNRYNFDKMRISEVCITINLKREHYIYQKEVEDFDA